MIYLISQMILALAVAGVLGMAIGWLIFRTASNRQTQTLKNFIGMLKGRLSQSQSEVSMLSDDYDEMQRQSHDQINALREENKQIPSLTSNLEKSQLLVRQMMQRHEAEVRDLTNENQTLTAKLARLDERSQTKNQLAAELDKRRRSSDEIAETPDAPDALDSPVSTIEKPAPITEHGEFKASKPALFAAAESDADPFDQVMEVEDDLQRELDISAAQKTMVSDASDLDATLVVPIVNEEDKKSSTIGLSKPLALKSVPLPSSTNKHDELNLGAVMLNADRIDMSLEEFSDLSQDADDLDNLIELDDIGDFNDTLGTSSNPSSNNTDELELDGSGDNSSLFGHVSQHDDLQQIFGIGPLTEKALNELGITSYSQLADLKQHQIQHIADALEIGTGRIVRDNWVGNARRQLEDVLEQL